MLRKHSLLMSISGFQGSYVSLKI